jgi:hypothetical protein
VDGGCQQVAGQHPEACGEHGTCPPDYYCNDHIPTEARIWDKFGPICPSCKGFIPSNENPGAYMGAISRKDNKTEICSKCGESEALADFFSRA